MMFVRWNNAWYQSNYRHFINTDHKHHIVTKQVDNTVLIFHNEETGLALMRELIPKEDRVGCAYCAEDGAPYKYSVEEGGVPWEIEGTYCGLECMRSCNDDPSVLEYQSCNYDIDLVV